MLGWRALTSWPDVWMKEKIGKYIGELVRGRPNDDNVLLFLEGPV